MTAGAADLRLIPVALTTWALTALAVGWPPERAIVGAIVLLVAGIAVASRAGHRARAVLLLIAAAGALAVSGLHAGAVAEGPVPGLAADGAQVTLRGVVASDPVLKTTGFAPYVLLRLTVDHVSGRGAAADVHSPVLVVADESWHTLALGERIEARGRLTAATSPDLAGVLHGDADPQVVRAAGWAWTGIGHVRAAIRESVAPVGMPQQALIPALVDGDDSALPAETTSEFQETGLTHLLAVSGSNLTLVLGFALTVARWCRVRGHWLSVVGLASVGFFVLLARPEPSVLRAAAMGVVGVAGLTAGGRARGLRALATAVVCLLLVDPWLARSAGFLLSTTATAGILVLAPPWRRQLARWLPGPLADAVAVPLSAQLVCTPVIAALSGQVSLAAVGTNLLAAPAVGPATVLGLVGGLVTLASTSAGHLIGRLAGLPAWWIVTVAHQAADLGGASLHWPTGPMSITALTLCCGAVIAALPAVLRRRWATVSAAALLALLLAQPWGRVAWPPGDWLLVMCDVGQGDALVLNAGESAAIVVDTGPTPEPVDRCLDDLGVHQVPLLVITHFHADHVGGIEGVSAGRTVGDLVVTPVRVPDYGAANIDDWSGQHDTPAHVAVPGDTWHAGELTLEAIAPDAEEAAHPAGDDEGSIANNASVVLRAEVAGHVFLLTGDVEPESERALLASRPDDLAADVVKVSHHGSANQDPAFYDATAAAVALISVGADNDYGHPSAATLAMLEGQGAQVFRTDQDGDVAVIRDGAGLAVVTSR